MAQTSNLTPIPPASNSMVIRELVVLATEETLNEGLVQRAIQPDQIISIMWQPGTGMAIGGHGLPQYRVIYRA